jgi:hypothetical protein
MSRKERDLSSPELETFFLNSLRFQVYTVMSMKVTASSDFAPSSLVKLFDVSDMLSPWYLPE